MPKTSIAPAGPAALTLLLGLWGIRRENSMWRDEAATWQVAHRTVPEIWHMLDRIDVVHGLYYLFMHGVFAVFGDSLLALRLPSVLAMAGAATLITLLGSRLADEYTGLAAGLAFALIPAVQQYAQEGRPYALVAACVALACWLLVEAVDSPGAGHWVAYSMAVLAGAILNWFSLLVLFTHAVTIALARPSRGTVLRWAVGSSAAVIGTLPLVMASKAQSGQVAWIPRSTRAPCSASYRHCLRAHCAHGSHARGKTTARRAAPDSRSPRLPCHCLSFLHSCCSPSPWPIPSTSPATSSSAISGSPCSSARRSAHSRIACARRPAD